MGKKYDIESCREIVDFCLKCDKKRCNGNCEDLKVERQRLNKEKRKKNESNSKNGQAE